MCEWVGECGCKRGWVGKAHGWKLKSFFLFIKNRADTDRIVLQVARPVMINTNTEQMEVKTFALAKVL